MHISGSGFFSDETQQVGIRTGFVVQWQYKGQMAGGMTRD